MEAVLPDNSIEKTILVKIGARVPIFGIGSHEERLVLALLKAIARSKGKALWTWSLSDGLQQVVGDDAALEKDRDGNLTGFMVFASTDEKKTPTRIKLSDYEAPVMALRLLRKWPGKTPALFVFLGLGMCFTDAHGNISQTQIVRLLKDIANEFPLKHDNLFLVDPTANYPSALEKAISIIDWPLPTAEDTDRLISKSADRSGIAPDLPNGEREKLVMALSGLTYTEQDTVLAEAVMSTRQLDAHARAFVEKEKSSLLRKAGIRLLKPSHIEDAGGLDLVKQARNTALATFTQKARLFGADRARLYLFGGLPGSGKSLAARFFAGQDMMLADINMGDLQDKYIGETDRRTRLMFETLARMAPIVARFDEFEKTFGNVDQMNGDNGTKKGQFGQWLTFTEENTSPVLMICTANWPDQLPPEAMSRFDEVFYFGEPAYEERLEILSIHLAQRGRRTEEYGLDEVALQTPGYVGRELKRVVVKALQRCFVEGERELTTEDLLDFVSPDSLYRVRPMVEIMPDKIKAIKLWGQKHATCPASSPSKIM